MQREGEKGKEREAGTGIDREGKIEFLGVGTGRERGRGKGRGYRFRTVKEGRPRGS